MGSLAQSVRIGLSLVAFVAVGVLAAPEAPTLLTARPASETAVTEAPAPPKPTATAEPPAEPQPAAPARDDASDVAAVDDTAPAASPAQDAEPATVDTTPDAPPEDAVSPEEPEVAALPDAEAEGPSPEEAQDEPPEAQPQSLEELTVEPPPLDFRIFRQPVATAATRLEVEGASVQLAGVVPLPADAVCQEGAPGRPCGAEARTALRSFLRGRPVICSMPIGDAADGEVTAPCLVGEEDIGEWIVANGWAEASDGSRYQEAEEEARSRGLGIWGYGGVRAGD